MVDKTKLTRDYETTPLKRGEMLSEDELRYLFIDLNLSTGKRKIYARSLLFT